MGLFAILFLNMVSLLAIRENPAEKKPIIRTSYSSTGNFTISEELIKKIHEALL